MREFSIGPEGYIKKIRGDVSILPAEDQKNLENGKLVLEEPSEKERNFQNWLNGVGEKFSLDQKHKKLLFYTNGALAGFCGECGIKISPPPITYYIPEELWSRVVEFYGEDVVGLKGGGVADNDNRILIHVREMRPNDPYYNAQRFFHFIANVCHENLHQLAYRAMGVENRSGEGDIFLARWGVEVRNPEKGKRYGGDFDEAIIFYFGNKLAEEVINGHRDLFGDVLGDGNVRIVMRDPFVGITTSLVERLAELRGGGPEAVKEVEKIFINAEFKGNLSDLGKEISKLYGKGGLRVLAHLFCDGKDSNRELMMKFIRAKKLETQKHYAFRILPPEEFERYKKLMAEGGNDAEAVIDQEKLAA